MRNNSGPRTRPYGTLQTTGKLCELVLVVYVLMKNNKAAIVSHTPYWCNVWVIVDEVLHRIFFKHNIIKYLCFIFYGKNSHVHELGLSKVVFEWSTYKNRPAKSKSHKRRLRPNSCILSSLCKSHYAPGKNVSSEWM